LESSVRVVAGALLVQVHVHDFWQDESINKAAKIPVNMMLFFLIVLGIRFIQIYLQARLFIKFQQSFYIISAPLQRLNRTGCLLYGILHLHLPNCTITGGFGLIFRAKSSG
jgi:hypothetical protein